MFAGQDRDSLAGIYSGLRRLALKVYSALILDSARLPRGLPGQEVTVDQILKTKAHSLFSFREIPFLAGHWHLPHTGHSKFFFISHFCLFIWTHFIYLFFTPDIGKVKRLFSMRARIGCSSRSGTKALHLDWTLSLFQRMDTTTELLGQSLVCWDTLLGLGHSVGLGYSIAAAWLLRFGLIKLG